MEMHSLIENKRTVSTYLLDQVLAMIKQMPEGVNVPCLYSSDKHLSHNTSKSAVICERHKTGVEVYFMM